MKSSHYCLVVLGIMTLLGVSAMSYNLAFAEISTDKPAYAKGELLDVSGTLDLQTGEAVNIVKIEITNLNDENNKIVDEYTPIDDNNAFTRSYETVTWQAGEYKVVIRYNQTNEETTFEILDSSSSLSDDDTDTTTPGSSSTGDDDTDTTTPGSSSTGDDDTDTTTPGLPSVDPQPDPVVPSNESNTMNNQVLTLQSANQQLRDENNQLKTQIEELNKRVEQLDAIVKEQIRVMMNTLAVGSTSDDDTTPGTGSSNGDDDDTTPGTGSSNGDDDDTTPGTSDNDIGIPGALKPDN